MGAVLLPPKFSLISVFSSGNPWSNVRRVLSQNNSKRMNKNMVQTFGISSSVFSCATLGLYPTLSPAPKPVNAAKVWVHDNDFKHREAPKWSINLHTLGFASHFVKWCSIYDLIMLLHDQERGYLFYVGDDEAWVTRVTHGLRVLASFYLFRNASWANRLNMEREEPGNGNFLQLLALACILLRGPPYHQADTVVLLFFSSFFFLLTI